MATFAWATDRNPAKTTQPRVLSNKFGDGYEQRVGDGINTREQAYDVTFSNRTTAEVDAIEAFLEARNGVESFDWTPWSGAAGKFKCPKWSRRRVSSAYDSVSAQFVRLYE